MCERRFHLLGCESRCLGGWLWQMLGEKKVDCCFNISLTSNRFVREQRSGIS